MIWYFFIIKQAFYLIFDRLFPRKRKNNESKYCYFFNYIDLDIFRFPSYYFISCFHKEEPSISFYTIIAC